MADERTPLIQIVQVRPARPRYPHHTLRRICTILLAIIPCIVLTSLLLSLFFPDHYDNDDRLPSPYNPWAPNVVPGTWPKTQGLSYEELENILTDVPDPVKAEEWSQYYTAGPHLAGQNLSQAIWTRDRWREFGVGSEVVSYDCYLNYPVSHRLALLEKKKTNKTVERSESLAKEEHWSVKYEASLTEDVIEEDGTSGLEDRIPTFHGYSASGNVTASYVYVNRGTYQDFQDLVDANVALAGKIAIVRYGGIFRGLKVKRAQDLGMVGVVIYSDPGDDGEFTEEHGYEPYPAGPARQPSSVQRGSVQFLSLAPGDPTTIGYPSKPGAERQPVDGKIPSIPSLPVSYVDALPLLKALNGYGPKAKDFNKYWQGGGLAHKGVKYNIGPSPDGLVLNLFNEMDAKITPLWNTIGVINGTISDEVVVLGNHRDAWIAGGAGDPNSGSAAMNELVRAFGTALEAGWKPLRTIVLASWDGEEYGLVGSTEWVEEYLPWLSASAVAYLNVDVGTSGPRFSVSAAPLLTKALVDTLHTVQSPNQTIAGQTVGDVWDGHIAPLGSGSDYTAFQDFAGIPSIDMGFKFGPDTAIYHYHSNYDSFHWMQKYGDPGYAYHATMARIWALLAVKIVETPVLTLNATNYAVSLAGFLEKVKNSTADSPGDHQMSPESHKELFKPMERALAHFHDITVAFDAAAAALAKEIAESDIPWWKFWERIKLYYRARKINTKYKYLERQFLYAKGLDGRSWFKHVVFAPGKWTGYAGIPFPGLVESLEEGDVERARRWAGVVVGVLERAGGLLDG